MGLCITLKYGDIVKIGDTELYVEKYSGSQVRLQINAPKDLKVTRKEKDKKYEKANQLLNKLIREER